MLLLGANEPGIYRIVNDGTGTIYIGSSCNVRGRLGAHRDMLRRGTHCNIHLQRSWDRDGGSAFVFEQLVRCPIEDLTAHEQWWVDCYRAAGVMLFNQRPVVESQLGWHHSEESRAKMSTAKRKMSAETRAKIGEANRKWAREHPEEVKARSANRRGKPSWNTGKSLSDETKQKISRSRKGTIPPEETRAKLRAARVGRRPGLGVRPSPEVVEKRAAAIKAAHAKKTPQEYAEIARKGWETRRRRAV